MIGTTVTVPREIALQALFDARSYRNHVEEAWKNNATVRLCITDEIDRRIRVLEEAVRYEIQSTTGTTLRHRSLVPLSHYQQPPVGGHTTEANPA